MANRIVAKTVGGPLDGQFYSVVDDQLEIVGMNGMKAEEYQLADDNNQPVVDEDGNAVTSFKYLDAYKKDESTQRDFKGEEKGAFDLLFPDFGVTQICEFNYEDNS